ncbi:MAG: hypothetical protein RL685_2513 [Pseudomonadota bacterium]|jgi:Kef-type K+ transport system membrane component KefB
MKKVLVVAALLGVMLVAGSLKRVGVSSAATLAGIGFVLLAAYAVAELGKSLSLPQVTGYIVAGVVLGPSVGGIISGEVVGEMRMFNTLALGLIATSAGLELDLRQLQRLGKTLLLTTLVKVLLGVSLVAGTLFLVESSLGLLGMPARTDIAILALIMGVLSIGTSPSITLAVLSETRAKGRLSDLVLGAAVFKDLVVVVGLAVAVAVARAVLDPGGSLDAAVLGHVTLELAGSIAAGSIVGAIFILYVRFIRAEMLLFVAAMILVVAELCRAFHLELLLVFIAAGFVVRNLSKFEHDLMLPLQRVALPVFVVFFANAGASIDLATTWRILPLALAVGGVRAGVYFVASRFAGKWAGESRVIQKHAWLAYLPQAGVTLGLVGLASLQVPELATPITNTGMAVVALNLLLGPVTLRRALALAGELPVSHAPGASEVTPADTPATPVPPSSDPASAPDRVAVAALPEAARRAHTGLTDALGAALARFQQNTKPGLPGLPELADRVPAPELFRQLVLHHRSAYQALYIELTSTLGQLPLQLVVERDTSPEVKTRALRIVRRSRRLPLRRLARIALEPAIARFVARSLEDGLRGQLPAQVTSAASELPTELESGLSQLALLLRDAGTRHLPTRRLRYSRVEPEVRRLLRSFSDGTESELARIVRAAWGTRLLERKRSEVTETLREIVARCVVAPALAAASKVGPAIHSLNDGLEQSRGDFATPVSPASVVGLRAELDRLCASAVGELSREFRFAAALRTTLLEMQTSSAALPSHIDCLFLDSDAPLPHGKVQSVQLRAHVEALVRHLLPPLELAARTVSTALSQLPRRIEDALRPEWTMLEAQLDEQGVRPYPTPTGEGLSRALRRVERASELTVRSVQAALELLASSHEAAYGSFASDVLAGPAAPRPRDAGLRGHLADFRQVLERCSGQLRLALLGPPALSDAAGVREALRDREPEALPDAIERWFDGRPVSDERTFIAHRQLLDQILDAESSRAGAGHSSVLIVGEKGAGKSSLLNLCELELPVAAHVRPRARDFGADTTLFDALATLLDCPATPAALRRHFSLHSPAVFVDDLSTWVAAARDRQLELRRILHLIGETRRDAFWLVSIDSAMLTLLGQLDRVEEVFTNVMRLPPLTQQEIRRLVESRLELANLDVTVHPARRGPLERLRPTREKEQLYRTLLTASDGIPGRVVALCRAAFHVEGRKISLRADAVRRPAAPSFDFSPVQLAILVTLQRYGPRDLQRLESELCVSAQRLQRSLAFLTACGLVTDVDDGHAYSVSPPAEWPVFELLAALELRGAEA